MRSWLQLEFPPRRKRLSRQWINGDRGASTADTTDGMQEVGVGCGTLNACADCELRAASGASVRRRRLGCSGSMQSRQLGRDWEQNKRKSLLKFGCRLVHKEREGNT